MSVHKNRDKGWQRMAGGAVFAISSAVACGNGFNSEDCKATRTCAAQAEAEAGQGGEPGNQGGSSAGGDSESSGGAGGAPVEPECTAAVDCSNGVAADGAEVCVEGSCRAGDAPPRVVSVTPGHESEGAEPDAPIVLEFSEALNPESVTSDCVQLLDGEASVPGKLSYEDGVATFLPDTRLRLRASYDVVVCETVTDEAGTPLVEPFQSTFSVRDGEWHSLDIPAEFYSMAAYSPMTASGAILLAWNGNGAQMCPGYAAWLELGQELPTPTPFAQDATDCQAPIAAVGVNGQGAIAWAADGPSYAQQYRLGAWEMKPTQASTSSQSWISALAVSPLGVVSRFERASRVTGVRASHTNAEGVWQTTRDELAPVGISVLSDLSIGFDEAGNGLAAFKAWDPKTDRTQIMVSRYTVESDGWASAEVVPGSASDPSATSNTLGAPAIAVAPSGEALVVWRGSQIPGSLRGSHFDPDEGWFNAETASPTDNVFDAQYDTASITYDGSRFIAAWPGENADYVMVANTVTYQSGKGWSSHVEHDAEQYVPKIEYPQIVSDGHGSSLLVWRTLTGNDTFGLVQRRLLNGVWGPIEPLPGGEVSIYAPAKRTAYMNASGVASLTWPVTDTQNKNVAIRVQRFY